MKTDLNKISQIATSVAEATDISKNGYTVLSFGNLGKNEAHISAGMFADSFSDYLLQPLSGVPGTYEAIHVYNGTKFYCLLDQDELAGFSKRIKK